MSVAVWISLPFTVEDVGPADLLLEAQTIELIDGSESIVPCNRDV